MNTIPGLSRKEVSLPNSRLKSTSEDFIQSEGVILRETVQSCRKDQASSHQTVKLYLKRSEEDAKTDLIGLTVNSCKLEVGDRRRSGPLLKSEIGLQKKI